MLTLPPAEPIRRNGRPAAAESPALRHRNLRWPFATLAGCTPRQIADDATLSEGCALRTVQAGIRAARALGPRITSRPNRPAA